MKELEGTGHGYILKKVAAQKLATEVLAEVQAKKGIKPLQGDGGTVGIDVDGVQLDGVWWLIRYGR